MAIVAAGNGLSWWAVSVWGGLLRKASLSRALAALVWRNCFKETVMPSALHCRPRLVRLALLVGCASLAACAPKPPQDLPPAPEAPSVTQNSPSPMLRGPLPGSEADFMAAMAGQDVIHFALDKFNIDPISASSLASQSQWLARYPGKHITIEGHCDERGTRDYNLALGERRAKLAHAARPRPEPKIARKRPSPLSMQRLKWRVACS